MKMMKLTSRNDEYFDQQRNPLPGHHPAGIQYLRDEAAREKEDEAEAEPVEEIAVDNEGKKFRYRPDTDRPAQSKKLKIHGKRKGRQTRQRLKRQE